MKQFALKIPRLTEQTETIITHEALSLKKTAFIPTQTETMFFAYQFLTPNKNTGRCWRKNTAVKFFISTSPHDPRLCLCKKRWILWWRIIHWPFRVYAITIPLPLSDAFSFLRYSKKTRVSGRPSSLNGMDPFHVHSTRLYCCREQEHFDQQIFKREFT